MTDLSRPNSKALNRAGDYIMGRIILPLYALGQASKYAAARKRAERPWNLI